MQGTRIALTIDGTYKFARMVGGFYIHDGSMLATMISFHISVSRHLAWLPGTSSLRQPTTALYSCSLQSFTHRNSDLFLEYD